MAGSNSMSMILCCLSLLCFSSSAIAGSDYFQFSLLWPGGYCLQDWGFGSKCCLPTTANAQMPALDFFVHGLKAYNRATGKPVTNCNPGCKFYVNAVADLITNLFEYWSDVDCPSNNGLDQWKGAWCTYGNCTNFDQITYIGKALNLRSKLNLLSRLENQGIVQSKTSMYTVSEIQNALMVELGFPAIIDCKLSGRNPWMDIVKFTFCIASDGETLIRCPIYTTTCRSNFVRFYPFTYDMLEGYDGSSAQLFKSSSEVMAM